MEKFQQAEIVTLKVVVITSPFYKYQVLMIAGFSYSL